MIDFTAMSVQKGDGMNIPKDVKRIYLASPYSHPDKGVMTSRFEGAALATAYLMDAEGAVVYSPIVHSHIVAKHLDNHLDHVFWLTWIVTGKHAERS